MAFFELYNAGAASNKPIYRKNSELVQFVPMKIMEMKPSVTVLGPTHQLNVLYNSTTYFFYLNKADHERFVELNGLDAVRNAILGGNHPYAVSIRKTTGLSTLILPSSKLFTNVYENSSL